MAVVVVAKHRGSAVPRSDASEVPITLLPRRGPAPRPTCSTRAHWSESSALLSDETAGAEASRRGTSSHGQIRRRTAQACNMICSGSLGPRWTRRACPVLCCRLGAWHGMACSNTGCSQRALAGADEDAKDGGVRNWPLAAVLRYIRAETCRQNRRRPVRCAAARTADARI